MAAMDVFLQNIDIAASKMHVISMHHGRDSTEYHSAVKEYRDAVEGYYQLRDQRSKQQSGLAAS